MNGNNITEIKKLLDRYYNGETTEAEEKQLTCYFAGEDVADELLAEKEIFLQLMNVAEPQIPMGLEERLEGAIDSWEAAERKAAENRRRIRPMSIRAIVSIAASLILVVALGVSFARPKRLCGYSQMPSTKAWTGWKPSMKPLKKFKGR